MHLLKDWIKNIRRVQDDSEVSRHSRRKTVLSFMDTSKLQGADFWRMLSPLLSYKLHEGGCCFSHFHHYFPNPQPSGLSVLISLINE